MISHLDAINDVIGIDLLSQSLLPAITELAQDGKWRVRLAVIENSPMIARQLGVQFFDEKLINICMTWLGDSVYSIRRAAAQNLKQLSDIFGEEWCKRQIVPKIKELHDAAGYSKRLTALFAIQVLLQSVSASTIQSSLLPLLAAMAKDSVANVRFNVAKILQTAAEAMKNMKPTGEIPQLLRQLSTDVDRDVRFYAEQVQFQDLIFALQCTTKITFFLSDVTGIEIITYT